MSPRLLRRLVNLWPPYLGAGIRVKMISKDFRQVKVEMPLTTFNRNYVGTQFGGSLYAMTDPFYMLMLIQNLGPNYIVWDKAAFIDFKKPGKGTVRANFELAEEQIKDIKAKADSQDKYIFDLSVNVLSDQGEVVAAITKTMYVRNKDTLKNKPTK